jgi:nucleotide-binding universal stress UspA family protein
MSSLFIFRLQRHIRQIKFDSAQILPCLFAPTAENIRLGQPQKSGVSENMKLLIGYDGSRSADAALDDLQKAGLPHDAEALIVSVAESWMPPPTDENEPGEYLSEVSPEWIERHQKMLHSAVNEVESFVRHAKERLQIKFPGWKISSHRSYGSPARQILIKSEEFCPDLIVIGSQGKNAVSRLFLGSVSNKVLTEAKCSVRVARGRIEVDPVPVRLIIGFDGSVGGNAAVEAVARRNWRDYSEVRLVTAMDSIVPSSIGRFVAPVAGWVEQELQTERRWIEKLAESALLKLKNAGFAAELCVRDGNPKQILVEEAAKWSADCIFVGANSLQNKPGRFLIGSTSAAIAERAGCSVEIVRLND